MNLTFYCIKDSDGDLVHTSIAFSREECINVFLHGVSERFVGIDPWETWGEKGYSVVPVNIIEV